MSGFKSRDEKLHAVSGGWLAAWLEAWLGARLGGDAVADAGGGADDGRLAELAAQAADGDRDGVGERVDLLVPDLLEEGFGAEEGGAGAQQRLEHAELLDRQVQRAPVPDGCAAQRVELETARLQDAGPGRGLPAGQGADAQDEFGEVKRLGQVVIGAQAQAADPVPG